jgi:hypothetical protein
LSHKNQAMMTLKGIHWLDIEYLKWDATCLREHATYIQKKCYHKKNLQNSSPISAAVGDETAASIPWRWCQKASWPGTSWNQGP